MIRHDDSAGSAWFKQQALSGGLIRQTRRFLPDQTDRFADWPPREADRDDLLQPCEGYTTESRYSPLGEVLVQTDAGGHRQHFSINRAGQLQRIGLTLKGQTVQPLLKATDYNAEGRWLTQIAGNDVTSIATYEASTGRLERLTATTSKRERLQALSYEYDAVGNIVRLVDHTQPVSYFVNQRVIPEATYTYDSLYQLTSAKGRETAGAGQNPGLPELIIPSPIDPGRLLNYTEYYEYDAGGNRTALRHESEKNAFTRTMRVDPQSNRALPWNEGDDAPDFKRQFDANGNLQHRVPGAQPMAWDARNQLQSLTAVNRSSAANDGECYRYNAAGERVVKFSTQQARTVTHQRVVHYLPGLEERTTDDSEELQVISVPLAHGSVRCLHWVKGKPDGVDADQLRYSLDDHLGSSSLEVDKHATVISHEGYYPYGGTAWWAARSQVDADYKTIRYSGKERDASGLYYYGFRYYAPWLGRWINPDPAGSVDGLNLYKMVDNNPIVYRDRFGQSKTPINKDILLIWAGENAEKLKAHTDNINNTVQQADGYKVHLHLDTYTEDAFSETIKELNVHDVSYVRSSELFNELQSLPIAKVYNDFRDGSEKNFAFAVDVTRVFLVDKLGALYSDVDDVYHAKDTEVHSRLGSTPLEAEPNQVLVLQPSKVDWETSLQINNSSFAAHADNATLNAILDEMVLRYEAAVQSIPRLDPMGLGVHTLLHEGSNRDQLLTSIVGPGVLTDVVTRDDRDLNLLLSNFNAVESGATPTMSPEILEQINMRMPLSRYIDIGSLGSW